MFDFAKQVSIIIMNKSNIALFTVITPSYVPFAISMTRSFSAFHPNIDIYIFVCGASDISVLPKIDKVTYMTIDGLKIPDIQSFLFKYSKVEACEAIRPYAFAYLLEYDQYGKIFYADADIIFYSSSLSLIKYLDKFNIILFPQSNSPYPNDSKKPSEYDILTTGQFNAGLLGIKNSTESMKFILWWQKQVYDGAYHRIDLGLYADQKWLDCVPQLFREIGVISDHRYNVAYWNLHERLELFSDQKISMNLSRAKARGF